jgi:hypothetical protein
MQSEFTFESGGHRGVAVRSDRPWGHGLKVNIFCEEGRLLNVIFFCCHPEFAAFDILQTMSTGQLIELAARQLSTGKLASNLLEARKANFALYMPFEIAPI